MEYNLQCRKRDDGTLKPDTENHADEQLHVAEKSDFKYGMRTSHVDGVHEL